MRRHPFCADPFGAHGGRKVPGAHVDHIVPLALGGTHTWNNVQLLCRACNGAKGIRTNSQQLRLIG